MYKLSYVENDAVRIDTFKESERDEAFDKWIWVNSRPDITEVEFEVMTVDVRFTTSGKIYTYLCEVDLSGYDYVDTTPELDETDDNKVCVYLVSCGYRSHVELKKMAKDRNIEKFVPLHGVAKRFKK